MSLTASAFDTSSAPVSGATFTWTSNLPAIASVEFHGSSHRGFRRRRSHPRDCVERRVRYLGRPRDGGAPADGHRFDINEIHYDNVGTDANEAIEVEGPAGTDLSGYKLVLYNGNGGAMYSTRR